MMFGGAHRDADARAGARHDRDAHERLGGKDRAYGLARDAGRDTPAHAGRGGAPVEAREQAGGKHRRQRRGQQLEIGATCRDGRGERSAARAVTEVASGAGAGQRARVAVGDEDAHVLAHHRAPFLEFAERATRCEDRMPDGMSRYPQGDRDFLM